MGYFNKPTVIVAFPSDERNANWLAQPEADRLGTVPPGYFARVKPKLSFGDTRERNRRFLKVSSLGIANADSARTDWEIAEFHSATLERIIKAWNLTRLKEKADGTVEEIPVEVNPTTIADLEDEDAQAILSVILKRDIDAAAASSKDPLPAADASETTSSTSTDAPAA